MGNNIHTHLVQNNTTQLCTTIFFISVFYQIARSEIDAELEIHLIRNFLFLTESFTK